MAETPKKQSKKATAAATPTAAPQATPAQPEIWEFSLKPDDSVFAIVTHKTGVAAKLAHNHLIAARQMNVAISANPKQLNSGKFTFKSKVGELEFDRKDLNKKWFPLVRELGWLSEPFSEIKDSDRETIREHALAADQLNAEKFPEISAQIDSISDAESQVGSKKFLKKAKVSITVHGQTVKKDFPANIILNDRELTVEAVAEFKFTDFGIKPYRALMGAIGNDDRFNMLVNFRAVKK
jgi:hypothetical protein